MISHALQLPAIDVFLFGTVKASVQQVLHFRLALTQAIVLIDLPSL